jgi:hypothetical protein
MITKPPTSVTAIARPLRVAYLIDRDACPDHVLNAIFRECYSRWGGRRTLIVPAKPDGVDRRYADWLWHYDPDIVYSFVVLEDDAVAHIHERYCPTYLRIDESLISSRHFDHVALPFPGLGSLSLVTALLNRRSVISGKISDLRIIDRYDLSHSDSQFIEENFGFVSSSYLANVVRLYSEIFSTLSLISVDSFASTYLMKDPASKYVTSEIELLEEFAKPDSVWCLAAASDFLVPHLPLSSYEWSEGVSVVVGDSVDDKLLFWNQHHRRDEVWPWPAPGSVDTRLS